MKRIGFLLVAISAWCSSHAQNITAIEYFFDADPGYGSGTSVSFTAAASISNLNFNVPVTSVSDGFHTLTVRAKDANNNWSHAFTRPFYKLPASAVASAANITKLEYFVDNDPGYGAGTNVTITPGTSLSDLSITVPLTSVSDGFHIITFRAQDANGNWSHAFTRPFYKLPASAVASAPNITKLEYFVDNDPGYGAGTSVAITAAISIIDLNVNAALTSVADGFHIITFRAQDANGNWSHAFNRPFYKLPATTGASAPNITKLEYFIDNDPGYGAGANVTITPAPYIVDLNVNAALTSVADGFHIITFRAQDANGNWSHAFNRPFYKLPASAVSSATNITKLEYFVDNDPGYGAGDNVTITPGTSIVDLNVSVALTSVADGFHIITFRAQNASGNWSHAFNRPFYKLPASAVAAGPNITRLEYFFDDDEGPGSTVTNNKSVTITPGSSISIIDLSVDVSALSTGTHKISFRAQDANGKWSIVHTSTFGVFGPAPAAQPTNLTFSTITTTSYTVNFTASSPAPDGGYIAIRKVGSAPTAEPVDGIVYIKGTNTGLSNTDGTVAYVGTATTFNETALLAGTEYFYKIYAYNGSTTLINYLTTNPLSGTTTTLADPVAITQEAFPETFDKGGILTVNVTVNSAAKASDVVLKYKGISEPTSALKSITVTNSANKFEKVIASSNLTDLIGIKYYFEVTDKSTASVITSDTGRAYVRYPATSNEQKFPSLSFGDKLSNYQIIAVPLILSNDNVNSVFSALGSYDNTQWRLFDYGPKDNGRANREYGTGAFSTIEPGKGYWLIARNSTIINPGAGTVAGSDLLIDETTPFPIILSPGWNLIGNPYNFTISWAQVLTASGEPSGIAKSLTLFNNGTLTADGSVLGPYRGAFIKNENQTDIELRIPVLRDTKLPINGRLSSEKIDLSKNQWSIPISVTNGELTNETGGIGMHPKAQLNEKDEFDRTRVPLLEGLNMPELIFSTFSKAPLTKNVIPTQDHFTWQFQVVHSGDEILKLQWPAIDHSGDRQMILLDIATQRVIDMTKKTEIMLSSTSKSLRIIFGNQNYINQVLEKELPAIGLPFPNPAQHEVKIPIFISESLNHSKVVVRVYSSLGKEVATLLDDYFSKGYHLLEWKHNEPAGLYVVALKVGNGEEKRVKLIIQ